MRKLTATAALALVLAAVPAFAASGWRQTASTRTWFISRPTADMTELQAALMWHYERRALDGLVQLAARPNVSLTDIGSGNSELTITMPRAAGDNWIAALSTALCSDVSTNTARLACVDAAIRADLRRIWSEYRTYLREQSTPVVEPPAL